MNKQFYFKRFSLVYVHSLNVKQFYLTHRYDPIRCYHTGQSGPRRDGNEWVLRIPQSSSITETSPSDCLVPSPGHSLWRSYLSAEMQSEYFVTPADWATVSFVTLTYRWKHYLNQKDQTFFRMHIWTHSTFLNSLLRLAPLSAKEFLLIITWYHSDRAW